MSYRNAPWTLLWNIEKEGSTESLLEVAVVQNQPLSMCHLAGSVFLPARKSCEDGIVHELVTFRPKTNIKLRPGQIVAQTEDYEKLDEHSWDLTEIFKDIIKDEDAIHLHQRRYVYFQNREVILMSVIDMEDPETEGYEDLLAGQTRLDRVQQIIDNNPKRFWHGLVTGKALVEREQKITEVTLRPKKRRHSTFLAET